MKLKIKVPHSELIDYSLYYTLSIKKDICIERKTVDNYYGVMDCNFIPFKQVDIYYLKVPKSYDVSNLKMKYDYKLVTGFKIEEKETYYEIIFYERAISYRYVFPLLEKCKILKIKKIWCIYHKPFDTYFKDFSMGEFLPYYWEDYSMWQRIYNISTRIVELIIFILMNILRCFYKKIIIKKRED